MIIDGNEMPLADWDLPQWEPLIKQKGFLAFEGLESKDIGPGASVAGYRIFYENPEGKLFPPVMSRQNLLRADNNEYYDAKQPTERGGFIHSPSDEGYYYWHDRDIAEAYLFTILADNLYKNKNNSSESPQGKFVLQRVEGIAKNNSIGQAGDVLDDMYVPNEDPLVSVRYSELFQK